MSDIVIREVTEEDYEGVVGIRTAYGGRDYLPGLYHNILKRHKGFVAILDGKMKLMIYQMPMKCLKSAIKNQKLFQQDVRSLSGSDIEELLSNRDLTKHLFSGDIFSSDWMPLRIMPENASNILADNGVVFGSNVDDAKKAMLSIGHPQLSSIGLSYVLDFYGAQHSHVKDHIVKHLQTVVDYKEETFQLEIFSEDSDISFIQKVVLDLGFQLNRVDLKEIYCIEQKLD
ncbi:hypothetical protein FSP39_005929 [Pinctada imbricata]|uniref:Histidine N-acetyltransferase C-terminal domain-containing protein n=1 Tax=Pinctada imbricata TaxID=66713 RepID=A0AA89BQ05_PINIB|nr:hypothetical protein FSP39_005929 [Pinctada imbricata]